jgi:DNA-binding MarR family transcriptional regulator
MAEPLMDLPCFSANLRRASRAVSRLYGAEIRKGGVEPTQFTLLAVLAQLDEAMQGELVEKLAIDSTTLTRTLARLEQRGWVVSRAGVDRRERWIRLTARGRRRYEAALPHWQAAQERLRKALGEENWAPLLERLVVVARAAEVA